VNIYAVKRKPVLRYFFTVGAVLLSAVVLTLQTSTAAKAQDEEIQVSADRLITGNEENCAEFVGNVIASQGAFVITSDRLKVYYREDLTKQSDDASAEDSIKKIIAAGNVRLISEDKVASAEVAVYDVAKKSLVLTGKEAKVTSGKNSVTGSKITFYRSGGRIKVERSARKRVKMMLYSKKKGEKEPPKKSMANIVETLEEKALESPADVDQIAKTPIEETVDMEIAAADEPSETTGLSIAEVVDQQVAETAKDEPEEPILTAKTKPDYELPEETAAGKTSVDTAPAENDTPADDTEKSPGSTSAAEETSEEKAEEQAEKTGDQETSTWTKIKDTVLLTKLWKSDEKPETGADTEKTETAAAETKEKIEADESIEVSPGEMIESPDQVAEKKEPSAPEEILIDDFVKISQANLKNKVGIALFENESFYEENNFNAFQQSIFERIYKACPNIIFLKPDDPNYPGYLKNLPRLASGRIDNLSLAKKGREFGLNTIITGSLVNIGAANERRGVLWMKSTRNIARVVLMVEVFDTDTGMKLLNESFVDKINVDEIDLESIKKKKMPELPVVKDALNNVSAAASKKISLTLKMQPWKGHVSSISGDGITISSGSDIGLVQNNLLEVYNQNVIQGVSGHRFYIPGAKTGIIRIVKVFPERSEAVLVFGSGISEGSSVRPYN